MLGVATVFGVATQDFLPIFSCFFCFRFPVVYWREWKHVRGFSVVSKKLFLLVQINYKTMCLYNYIVDIK